MARDISKYIINGARYLSVTEVLSFSGWSNYSQVDPTVLARAGERGHLVHAATEDIDLGVYEPDKLREDLQPYVDAFMRFKAETDYHPIEVETVVHDQVLQYDGQLDRIGMLDGKLTVLDVKTSQSRKPEWGLQLAAYAKACGRDIQKRVALRLGLGFYEIDTFNSPHDFQRFVDALHVVQAQVELGAIEIPMPEAA